MRCLITVFGLLLLCTTGAAQMSWQAIPNAPGSHRFDDIFFLTPLKGWAINPFHSLVPPFQYGQVFRTDDGGRSWTKLVDTSRTYYRAVGFADEQHGWLGNLGTNTPDTNFLYQTSDGGSTWQPVSGLTGSRPRGICGISVASDSVVYAYGRVAGPAALIKTVNKGLTWQSQDMTGIASCLIDGVFFHPDTGFVTGSYDTSMKAQILYTNNGGATWQVSHRSNRPHEFVWKISFPSPMVGYASIQGSYTSKPDTSYYLKTTDGGKTWKEHVFRTDGYYKMQGIGFINDSTGWIGGDDMLPVNYKTTNGGRTWAVDSSFGIVVPPYSNFVRGYSINRFRRFGDSLMYASGKTIYRFGKEPAITRIPGSNTNPTVEIYPNPFSNYLMIRFSSPAKPVKPFLSLYNMLGQVIVNSMPLQEGENRVPVVSASKGLHVYRIQAGSLVVASGIVLAQ